MRKERKAEYISDATLQNLRNAIEEPLKREINQLTQARNTGAGSRPGIGL